MEFKLLSGEKPRKSIFTVVFLSFHFTFRSCNIAFMQKHQ
uniref:Uncharacterized protein n=1 Tax=Anguilla anguilla TaxID=7936 RepID=A0A0E9S199_ANGAN